MARRGQRRNDENHMWLIFMLTQLYQQVERMPFKPPITLGVSALCLIAHLQPSAIPLISGHELDVCLNPAAIMKGGPDALIRFAGSAFVHGSDTHVYYNIASFIFKV